MITEQIFYGVRCDRCREDYESSGDVVARLVVHLGLHVGQLEVVGVLVPLAVDGGVELAQHAQVNDVTLLDAVGDAVDHHLASQLCLAVVEGAAVRRRLHDVLKRLRAVGDYSAIVALFGHSLHLALQESLFDFKFQCHCMKFYR